MKKSFSISFAEDLANEFDNDKANQYFLYFGKVDTLFVPMGTRQFGVFHPDENRVDMSESLNGEAVDLINYAAISAIRTGSTLYGLPQSQVPKNSGLAAIYRYKS